MKDATDHCCQSQQTFTAGSETTSKSLLYSVHNTYALALRILYPEVQDRVQQGLDRMAARGGRQHITMADKVNLPYVEATLNEVCGALVIWPPVGRPASCARSCRLGWNDFAIFEIGNIAADQFKLIAEFCHAAKFSF